MRKTAILSLCSAVLFVALVPGCATGSKGPSDAELIAAALDNWKVGMETKDTGKIALMISDTFNHYEFGNKTQMISFLAGNIRDGNLDGARVALDTAETKIVGDTASVYPVELIASFGSATLGFDLAKEADGQWRATSITVEGI